MGLGLKGWGGYSYEAKTWKWAAVHTLEKSSGGGGKRARCERDESPGSLVLSACNVECLQVQEPHPAVATGQASSPQSYDTAVVSCHYM